MHTVPLKVSEEHVLELTVSLQERPLGDAEEVYIVFLCTGGESVSGDKPAIDLKHLKFRDCQGRHCIRNTCLTNHSQGFGMKL